MSTTLSISSRQWESVIGTTSQVQSVYSSVPTPGSCGGRMSWSGSEPSTSCQISSWSLTIAVAYFWVRARSGTRRA